MQSSCGIEALNQSGALNQNLAFNLRDDVPNALCGKLENRHRP